jgi:hypothetical protein
VAIGELPAPRDLPNDLPWSRFSYPRHHADLVQLQLELTAQITKGMAQKSHFKAVVIAYTIRYMALADSNFHHG